MKHIAILPQPNDTTCGPTSLHAVYSFYGDKISLKKVIKEVHALEDGGTLAVLLGQHALSRGYSTTLYTFNLKVCDPTWDLKDTEFVVKKLKAQLEYKKERKLRNAILAYIGYLEAGGKLRSRMMSRSFFASHFNKGIPILAGLSATYLYQTQREYSNELEKSIYDDLKGSPMGHFVVLNGFDSKKKIRVSDPYPDNPVSGNNYYSVGTSRLIHSILLGIVTYDANLLVIERPA
jgi:hypothetical protein